MSHRMTEPKINSIDKVGLLRALEAFSQKRVLVFGDVMLDHYIIGDSSRISPEAPVPVVRVDEDHYSLGGAANVAKNITALGGEAALVGTIGDDPAGTIFREELHKASIRWLGREVGGRPTIQKIRVLARGQQLLRVDREENSPSKGSLDGQFLKDIEATLKDYDVIVISDYAKGFVTPELIGFLKGVSKGDGLRIIVDPKPQNMALYKGLDLITPNRAEALEMAKTIGENTSLEEAMAKMLDSLDLQAILVTLGEKGMAIFERGETGSHFYIPTMAREVYDVTGAGDTVVAILALGLASGLNLKEAGYLANVGAGIVVGKLGTATVTKEELSHGIKDLDEDLGFLAEEDHKQFT